MEHRRDPFEGQIYTQKDEYNLSPTRPFRTLLKKNPNALLQIQAAYSNSSFSSVKRRDVSAILPIPI
jgi:hypothetical protein